MFGKNNSNITLSAVEFSHFSTTWVAVDMMTSYNRGISLYRNSGGTKPWMSSLQMEGSRCFILIFAIQKLIMPNNHAEYSRPITVMPQFIFRCFSVRFQKLRLTPITILFYIHPSGQSPCQTMIPEIQAAGG
jgi:hypothetical protein